MIAYASTSFRKNLLGKSNAVGEEGHGASAAAVGRDWRAGEAASFEGQFLRYGEPECPGEAS